MFLHLYLNIKKVATKKKLAKKLRDIASGIESVPVAVGKHGLRTVNSNPYRRLKQAYKSGELKLNLEKKASNEDDNFVFPDDLDNIKPNTEWSSMFPTNEGEVHSDLDNILPNIGNDDTKDDFSGFGSGGEGFDGGGASGDY